MYTYRYEREIFWKNYFNLFHEMFSNKQNLKHEYILYNYFNLRE